MKGRVPEFLPLLSVLLITLIIFITLTACGRKGDPVLITPDDKIAAESSFNHNRDGGSR